MSTTLIIRQKAGPRGDTQTTGAVASVGTRNVSGPDPKDSSTTTASWKDDRWRKVRQIGDPVTRLRTTRKRLDKSTARTASKPSATSGTRQDPEAQRTVADVLYGGYSDELEDLTPDERDVLVRYSFQHSALRAKRPVVWIPRDQLGVSDDEIRRTKRLTTVEDGEKGQSMTNIWISNEGTALDGKGKVVYGRPPPDFSNVDLIAL